MHVSPPQIFIRADASPSMGTGHVMRCWALAQAARAAGMDVRMICRIGVDWVRERLTRENIPLCLLDGEPPREERPEDLLRQLRRGGLPAPDGGSRAWVVLDGYHFTGACQKAVQRASYRLLVIDDCAHLPEYCCDILLNQNVGAEILLYQGNVGHFLLGPSFALLRPEFEQNTQKSRDRALPVFHILLTLGGGDFSSRLPEVARILSSVDLRGVLLHVLAGHMSESIILEAFADFANQVRVLRRVDNMALLLQTMDMCITAGGSTCWELACVGLPFLTLQLAENQRIICDWLRERGYAPRFTKTDFLRLLHDGECRRLLSIRLRQLVDGQGAASVVRAVTA